VTDIYSRNLVGDLVDNICNFVFTVLWRFISSFNFFLHYRIVIWVTKNSPCIKMVIFLILSEKRARVYVLTGVLVRRKYDYYRIL